MFGGACHLPAHEALNDCPDLHSRGGGSETCMLLKGSVWQTRESFRACTLNKAIQ
ncbi:hypothetical protein BCR37DRAFT_378811 [Protomyces lactucae-debilis]|uniref:Uncharacterized protein n=1 Tax=Protomyces lactucae-debilis TaxID=2754530 RepID=A0A1Y2FIM9_PROLT|nr:uncharacterized protein BCR37DRAFT_378811 [Protomyces lactucae-debilis]ORY83801.1 hypothetical protein BCR37DRAFT_378811 [Protomyces lactucae-debilis]